jgi:hypothetical protein
MCKQVSRLGIILLRRLPVKMTVTLCRFIRFTVTGIVRKFHPRSLGIVRYQHSLCINTSYSFADSVPQAVGAVNNIYTRDSVDFKRRIWYNYANFSLSARAVSRGSIRARICALLRARTLPLHIKRLYRPQHSIQGRSPATGTSAFL